MKRKKSTRFVPTPRAPLTDKDIEALEKELVECGDRPAKILRAKVIRATLEAHRAPKPLESPLTPRPPRSQVIAPSERSQAKREAVLHNTPLNPRTNNLDVCDKCHCDLIVDKELAKRTCPKCGACKDFASHMFDVSEEGEYVPQTAATPVKAQHRTQFHKAQPMATRHVMETLHTSYQKYHMVDPARVQTTRTQAFLKAAVGLPATYRNAPLRLSKELKAEPLLLT